MAVLQAGRLFRILTGESGLSPPLHRNLLPVDGGGGKMSQHGRSGIGMLRVSQKKQMSSGIQSVAVFLACIAIRLKGYP